MRWTWRLGKLGGIAVYMHATFLLLLGWVALSHFVAGRGVAGAANGVAFILLLFVCVVAHEYGHALTARRYGIQARDITLLPIGGVARLERMPREPMQELWVALAGPAVNVVIAAAPYAVIQLLGRQTALEDLRVVGGDLLSKLMWVNVTLVAFNLLPAFPMDGGRVLRALLAGRMEYARATRTAANVGQLMAFLFGFLGLAYNPFLLFIALFVYMGAEAEAQAVQVQVTLEGRTVRDVMVTRFGTVDAGEPLSRAVDLLLSGAQQDFPVLEDGEVVGVLGRSELVTGLQTDGPRAPIARAMRRDATPVEAGAFLEQTFQKLQEGALSAVPVIEQGALVGMVTRENIAEFLMVQTALTAAQRQSH
ncbi:MAG: site-2 protease family protein [Gemmatimonadales bacterium]